MYHRKNKEKSGTSTENTWVNRLSETLVNIKSHGVSTLRTANLAITKRARTQSHVIDG